MEVLEEATTITPQQFEAETELGDFRPFAEAIHRRFEALSNFELFVVDSDRDAIWEAYLNAFPQGTNPVFRTNTVHDCSCCRHFVRSIGNVVAIVNGEIATVWEADGLEHPYDVVAGLMHDHVTGLPIRGVFRTKEGGFGAAVTREMTEDGVHNWHHFNARIDPRHRSDRADTEIGQLNTSAQVFRRGLEELTVGALESVADLIEQNALYRGEEHKAKVADFLRFKRDFDRLDSDRARELFAWEHMHKPAARFRNSVIGTLVTDLSNGMDMERAVRAFETKVAPANYKRPKALITPRMIETAMSTIRDLGLEDALHRRFARLTDVSVNDVLFVDSTVQGQMKDGVEALLMEEAARPKVKFDGAQKIGVDNFMSDILPGATGMDLLLTNKMLGNFVSLTAPVHADAGRLFRWPNNFGWSYDGNVTDSIKEKVKRAGGDVDAHLRVSLAWWNTDDLDLHVVEPSGNHVYYGHKCGVLDVDMNVSRLVRDPVENLRWDRDLPDGLYKFWVNQYRKRESVDVGFEVEMECNGETHSFRYDKPVSGDIPVLAVNIRNGLVENVVSGALVQHGSASRDKWGVSTEELVKVNTLVLSPNHWGESATGNKHWFFILDGCRNPDAARGIYNEFLKPELEQHRKVFEVLGDKMKCQPTDDQMSGVGFSSTRQDEATVLVHRQGRSQPFNIIF